MKFNLKLPKKLLIGMSITALCSFIFASSSYASIEDFNRELKMRNSKSYEEWLSYPEELQREIPVPSNSSVTITRDIKIKYLANPIPSIISALQPVEGYSLEQVGASYADASYNLNRDAKIRVKNQYTTNECWAFSVISSLESNISLLGGNTISQDYSERHLDYATAKTFLDGVNPIAFGREVGEGGLAENGYAYLTNGTGAVLERYMPFEDDENPIYLNSINQPVETIATGYGRLPTILKKYYNGVPTYYNSYGQQLSDSDLKAYRNIIKNHIVKYGALSTIQAANKTQYYDNNLIGRAKSYYNNDQEAVQDHELTIVGWDDNYSRNNFNENYRPVHDGAYICLNTYGTDVFDNGYLYVSYDDVLVEKALLGVKSTSSVDYNHLYQHDFFGGYFEIGAKAYDTGYYGSIFERSTDNQFLTHVGVTVSQYVKVEIYVNPTGTSMNISNLKKIGSAELEPGYTRINVDKTQITSNRFSIVVKQIASSGTGFYFPLESRVRNSVFENVSAQEGTSYISFDGLEYADITKLSISNMDMASSDVCIKAFTQNGELEEKPEPIPEPEPDPGPTQNPDNDRPLEEDEMGGNNNNQNDNIFEEETLGPNNDNNTHEQTQEPIDFKTYTIKNNDIYGIPLGMNINQFKSNIDLKGKQVKFFNNNEEITDLTTRVGTGMIMKVDNISYTFILTGDVNGDGKLSLVDVSKMLVHYNEFDGMELKGAFYKAADMNGDGTITLTDLSKIVVEYNKIP